MEFKWSLEDMKEVCPLPTMNILSNERIRVRATTCKKLNNMSLDEKQTSKEFIQKVTLIIKNTRALLSSTADD